MGEEAINGFIRVHVTVFKHSIDLLLSAVIDYLFQALNNLPGPSWYSRNSSIAFPIAAQGSSSAAASPSHSLSSLRSDETVETALVVSFLWGSAAMRQIRRRR